MRKIIFAISILGFSCITFAQQHAFKFNLAALAFKSAELSYEEVAHKHSTIEISVAQLGLNADTTSTDYKNFRGYNLDLKYKIYFSSKEGNMRGLYIAPSGSFTMPKTLVADKSYYGGALTLGYQFVFGGDAGFALDISAGESYHAGIKNNLALNDTFTGFRPQIGFRIGYAFDSLSGM
jgi:hypothetical protein